MTFVRMRTQLLGVLLVMGMILSAFIVPHPNLKNSKGGGPARQYVYLTFDDGPLAGSEYIDSIVLRERLKISVFVVGEHAAMNPKLAAYLRLYDQNPFIEVYNHSYTHANNHYAAFYKDPGGVLADVQRNEAALGLRYHIVRLPGRNIWRIGNRKKDDGTSGGAAADLLAAKGYRLIGWDLEWQHHPTDGTPVQSVAEMVSAINSRLAGGNTFTPNHLVLLLHDEMFQKKWEETELKQLIDTLRANDRLVFEHIRFYPQ